jgi:hypothetical protein
MEFCADFNKEKTFKINPMNADITMLCTSNNEPFFISYSAKFFKPPISESDLILGKGLTILEDQKAYSRFVKANDWILEHDSEAAKKMRHCSDEALITEFLARMSQNDSDKIKKP